jgi:hypothetical protein
MEPPVRLPEDIRQGDDLLYDAWCVIANAVGWDDDTEWRRAAIRWRDAWHQTMDENHE